MPPAYTLDNQVIAGEIVINLPGHPCYLAGTMHTAELFVQRLTGDTPIELPAQTQSSQLDELHATVDRIIARIAVDGLAEALIAARETLGQHIVLRESVYP